MYIISKLFQAIGISIIAIGFIRKFPHLLDYQTFFIGIGFFLIGWIIGRALIKK